jgi:hypothetical protein
VAVLEVNGTRFRLLPVPLLSVRPFVFGDVSLAQSVPLFIIIVYFACACTSSCSCNSTAHLSM